MALDPTYHTTLADPFGAPVSGKSQPLAQPFKLTPMGSGFDNSTIPGVLNNPNPLWPDQETKTAFAAPAAPTVTASGTGGTIPTGSLYTKLAWVTPLGTTQAGPETTTAITLGQNGNVVVPSFPSGVTGAIIGASSATGTETQQMTVNAPGTYVLASLTAGTAMPTTNTALYNPFAVSQV